MLRNICFSCGSSSRINNIIDYAVVVWYKENEQSTSSILCSASILTPKKLITIHSVAMTIYNEIKVKKSISDSMNRYYVTFGPLNDPLNKEYKIREVFFPGFGSLDSGSYGIIKVSDEIRRAQRVKPKFIFSAIYRILQMCSSRMNRIIVNSAITVNRKRITRKTNFLNPHSLHMNQSNFTNYFSKN